MDEVTHNDPYRSATIGKIAAALALAQAEIQPATKSATNPQFKRNYATLSDIWEACRAALTKQGLSISQQFILTEDPARPILRTTLAHSSGEYLGSEMQCLPREATSQAIGSAATYNRKYGLAAMVGVAPDEDDDGNAASKAPSQEPTRRSPNTAVTMPVPAQAVILPVELRGSLPWTDRDAMEAAFAQLREKVGPQRYYSILSDHDISTDLRGKVGKLTAAFDAMKEAVATLPEGAAV